VFRKNFGTCLGPQFMGNYMGYSMGLLWENKNFGTRLGCASPTALGPRKFWEHFWEPLGCLWEGFGMSVFLLVAVPPQYNHVTLHYLPCNISRMLHGIWISWYRYTQFACAALLLPSFPLSLPTHLLLLQTGRCLMLEAAGTPPGSHKETVEKAASDALAGQYS
jgi:hypothetical protein